MQLKKQTNTIPVLAYGPHHRAIAHVLTRKYKKGVVIEANRRLMDVVGKEDRPPALKNPVTSRPVAAIGYSKASYQIIVIVAFMDEWKGGARKKLQRFCWESAIPLYLFDKQLQYQERQFDLYEAAEASGLPAEETSTIVPDVRCPHCRGPLIQRSKFYKKTKQHEVFFACAQYGGFLSEGSICAGFICSADELNYYLNADLAEGRARGKRQIDPFGILTSTYKERWEL